VAANELHLSMDLRFVFDVLAIAYLHFLPWFGGRLLMATLICMFDLWKVFCALDAWVVELNVSY
jgi:hypothetical protein